MMTSYSKITRSMIAALFIFAAAGVSAEESTMEKAGTKGNEVVDGAKESYRDVKDEACETINGKLECAGKKVANKAKTLKDKTTTKVKEIKNKAD